MLSENQSLNLLASAQCLVLRHLPAFLAASLLCPVLAHILYPPASVCVRVRACVCVCAFMHMFSRHPGKGLLWSVWQMDLDKPEALLGCC